ncbi:GNAT family N-acetyltransferase [Bacillus sp. HU-1818]|uniref:GNAT family N-acetyltransferase n=1 Tax=Bacillus sp. HU-1818 TaxID=2704469 RepID=UPI001F5D3140|nr:GNAT family N-acetyltransferase [Bacillus sp. HU-1818]MCI3194168.1 GNAT family N-acetyltransferase [Bacillus sp. HU-1818]
MSIEIKAVTKDNRAAILALHVNESQTSYIESTEQCLKEADECHYYQPVGLYYEGKLVGFAMYGWFPEYDEENEEGRVWLDRFFIDERFQGQGLGSIMLQALIQHLAELYKCKRIYLSIFENNTHALRLYQKFGFTYNGELDFNGEKVMLKEL